MKPAIPEVPVELVVPLGALVRAASLFRGAVVEAARLPLREIFEERGEALRLAEQVIDLWTDRLGLALPTPEGEAAGEASKSNGASKQAMRGKSGENGTSTGKKKRLRKGGERATVKPS